jgi:hypothetical protein
MELAKFRALIPVEDYLVNHSIQVGDLVCVDSIVHLQNITNSMTIAIPKMKRMTVVGVWEGLITLSTHPINADVKSVTKIITSGMFSTYVSKDCCLISDLPIKTVSQLNLFEDEESIPH